MNEIWKAIPGWENYEVSNLGNVKSKRRDLMMSTRLNNGYCVVSFRNEDGSMNKYVHRLVAFAWLPNYNSYSEVNHINGIKTDNRVENLEWCSRKHNMNHASVTKLLPRGKDIKSAKLTEADVIFIRKSKLPRRELMKRFNVSAACIYEVKTHHTWAHVAVN